MEGKKEFKREVVILLSSVANKLSSARLLTCELTWSKVELDLTLTKFE